VDYNSIVKKDQLLAEIDPQLLQVQVDIQNANIERQMSDIANQKVQLDDQKKQFERTKSLFERGLQNQQQFETAELAIKTREAQIASAEKSLVQARANLEAAKLNVEYTKIKAPADGVIVERRVDVGQTVQASMQTPSFFVLSTPLENLKLTAGVDEAEIGKIRPGMEVRFTVESYGQQPFYGQVENIRLNATNMNNVVTYPVWITVPNPDLKLRPFMTASLRIILSTASNVVRIPNTALRFRPNADIYRALGIEAPQPGGGRNMGPGGSPDSTNNSASAGRGGQQGQQNARGGGDNARPGGNAQAGQNPQGMNAQAGTGNPGRNRQPGQGGNQGTANGGGAGSNQQAGGGRGGGGNRPSLTPEQLAQFQAQFGRGGGRGGNQGGGRGGNQGRGRGAMPGAVTTGSPVDKDADKIDELWASIPVVETNGNVWKLDENKTPKELTQLRLRLGISDGTFTQLISGDVKVGDQVLTSIILPASMRPQQNTNPLLQQQNRGGMGGMTGPGGMGGGGGAMPGGGGGGAAGGGGGGRGGGGGGGGRGGN
jgi:HlyD family secretion protein